MSGAWAWLAPVIALVPGFGAPQPSQYTGYIEANYLYLGPVTAGPIVRLPVHDGETVKKGQVLFVLDQKGQEAALAAAKAQVEAAAATLKNLETGGRPQELAAARAAVNKAEADRNLADATYARAQKLFGQGVVTKAQLDQDRSNLASAGAAVHQAEAQLAVTGLPARAQQQAAAAADLAVARANADNAQTELADRIVRAPADGLVEKVFYDPGEMASLGVPVVSLLPKGRLKAEFYVNETARAKFALGQKVAVTCDGCPAGLTGTVTDLASQPQYTSPIIYSREARDQLVFRAEARLDIALGQALPGQPVTIRAIK